MNKIICIIAIILIFFVTACIDNCKTVSEVMERKGFNEKSILSAQVSDGKTVKNLNQYITPLLEAMKNTDLVSSISSSPLLHIHIQTGSSSPSQVIRFHVSESGEGYIEYKDKKIACFKGQKLYEAALDAFYKSSATFDLKSIMENTSYLLSKQSEEEMVKKEGDFENLSKKIKNILVKDFDIEGQWDSYYHHDGVHLFIEKNDNNLFNIYYHASSDLWSWSFIRTATFKNGVLEFNKPVEEYSPYGTYKHFYLLKTPYGTRLVSQPRVRRYLKQGDWYNIDNLLYKVSDSHERISQTDNDWKNELIENSK
jgi:hypothetical protein